MRTNAGQVGLWVLIGGAAACLILFIVLIDTPPTVTYTLPEDEDQEVVAECNNTSWGLPEFNEIPIGDDRSRTHHRIIEGEDAYQQAQEETREAREQAGEEAALGLRVEGVSVAINDAHIDDDCLRANGLRQHQLMWTGLGGLLLVGAGGYVDLRRRRP